MYKVEHLIGIAFIESDVIKRDGTLKDIIPEIRKGYLIEHQEENHWILTTPTQVFVTIDCGKFGAYTVEMKKSIEERYKTTSITKKTVNKFREDFKNGKITIYYDKKNEQIVIN